MRKEILEALLAEAEAQETKAAVNLKNYLLHSSGVGEHPDIVAECMKLVKDIAEASIKENQVDNGSQVKKWLA